MNSTIQNLNNRKIWAIIPAAGSGNRFSKDKLKQYQLISDKTVLEHTVNRIMQLPIEGCVLAIAQNDTFAKTLQFDHADKLHFCIGGQERVDSVLNALNYLSEIADDHDLVFVHDAARPCVAIQNINDLIQTAIDHQCSAILATPVRDTLKKVQAGNDIQQTVDRHQLWQAQTPQISIWSTLKSSIEQALKQQIVLTDEASALEYMGHSVKVVSGRADNIKITYPEDLELARLIMMNQEGF